MIDETLKGLLALIHANWKLLMGPLLFILLTSNYLITSWRSSQAIRSKCNKREPPIVPYWIPFVGSLIPIVKDSAGFISQITEQFGRSIPVQVKIGPLRAYLITAPKHFLALLKSSRDLNPKPAMTILMENMFGTPSTAIHIYKQDNSGIGSNPKPGSTVKPENRVYYQQHHAAHMFLSGQSLQKITQRFLRFLSLQTSENSTLDYEWVEMPDFCSFVRNQLYEAAVKALFGSHILRLNPTLSEDFWEYFAATPILAKGLPRWMARRAYQKRDKMIKSIAKWHRFAVQHSDYTSVEPSDDEWDPYWGSDYLKVRQKLGRKRDSMNDDAIAAEDLSLMLAANANAISCAIWILVEIYRDPLLLARVAEEVTSAQRPPTDGDGPIVFDIVKLCAGPLLQSVYAETLRLRIALLISRVPEDEDFHLGEWVLRKKRVITMSSVTAAMNEELWSSGGEGDPHPLNEFWAERFLVYPDRPQSGPVRKNVASAPDGQVKAPILDPPASAKPVFSIDGTAGGWIPYGGGPWMCPGRHFAKQEMIASFAMFFAFYDIELRLEKGFLPKPNMDFYGLGVLPPSGKVPFRIRRKALTLANAQSKHDSA